MADWNALVAHLQEVKNEVVLGWPELDAIVDGVPPSAARHRAWWGGDRTHVRAWQAAGFTIRDLRMGDSVTFVRVGDSTPLAMPAGDSRVQRKVEALMLDLVWDMLGVQVAPRRLTSPSGAYIDVDGAADDGSVLVECWAHQGSAKAAQKYKLVNDAAKLQWASTWLEPRPERLILCVSDEAAVSHLRGKSWQSQAIRGMGVEIVVVDLPAEEVQSVQEAQQRQFR